MLVLVVFLALITESSDIDEIFNFCFKLLSFTLPAGAMVKYCNEDVRVSVCLSARISPEPHVRSLPNFLCMLPTAVARSSSGR